MPALTGPFTVSIALLALAGAFKIWQPTPTSNAMSATGLVGTNGLTRLIGATEIAIAITAFLVGGLVPSLLVAAAYVGFTGFVLVALRKGLAIQSCGCFGKVDTPPSWAHVAVNGTAAIVAVIFGLTALEPLATYLTQSDAGPLVLGILVATYLVYVLLAILPAAPTARRS